jgi:hypothetical protein
MNPDEFEKHLQSRPLGQVPAQWRQEILFATRQAVRAEHAPCTTHHARVSPTGLSAIGNWLSAVLWPRPVAWAALAAVWLVILGLNLATNTGSPRLVQGATPPSPQLFMAFQEQQRLLSELLGPQETPVAEPPKPAPPRPRSDLRRTLLIG